MDWTETLAFVGHLACSTVALLISVACTVRHSAPILERPYM